MDAAAVCRRCCHGMARRAAIRLQPRHLVTLRSVRMLDLRFKPSLPPIGVSLRRGAEASLVSRGRRCRRRPWVVWIWLDADT